MDRKHPKAKITQKAERTLRSGHPWVFSDEVLNLDSVYENGALVDVYSTKDKFLGTGFINDNSKIRIRIISRNANDRFDRAFYYRRVKYAIEYRHTVMRSDFNCCRLIFGEADSFPGLTVDKYEDVLVVQILSLGIERIKDMLFSLIVDVLGEYGVRVRAIYERNDVGIREKEGMEQGKGFYGGLNLETRLEHELIIEENGIKYSIDIENGQKTGFFLDQKYNRLAAARIAGGRNVLDCFTHTGAFALNAAKAGAAHVTAVDISQDAVELTKHNAQLNALTDSMSFICADVFDLLTELEQRKKHEFDYIILDPPAFTKNRSTLGSAIKGYKAINAKAMRLLPRGGYLATCSCSHFMTEELFKEMLANSAADADVQLRQIASRKQSPDHPILWNVPETDYLKFYIFQVV